MTVNVFRPNLQKHQCLSIIKLRKDSDSLSSPRAFPWPLQATSQERKHHPDALILTLSQGITKCTGLKPVPDVTHDVYDEKTQTKTTSKEELTSRYWLSVSLLFNWTFRFVCFSFFFSEYTKDNPKSLHLFY